MEYKLLIYVEVIFNTLLTPAVVPPLQIWSLKMSKSRKLGLVAVFLVGAG